MKAAVRRCAAHLAAIVIALLSIAAAGATSSTGQTARRMTEFPSIQPVLDRFREHARLAVHYVGVSEASREDGVVDVEIGPTVRGLLVLSSERSIGWRLHRVSRRRLLAILIAGHPGPRWLEGVPRGLDVYRLEAEEMHVDRLRPECNSYGHRNLNCYGWTEEHGTPFLRVDKAIEAQLGHRITSATLASSAASVVVPGVTMTNEMRAALEVENKQIARAYRRIANIRNTRRAFESRYYTEQQQMVADMLSGHPALETELDAATIEHVHIVSIVGGMTDPFAPDPGSRRYQDFRASKDAQRALVELRYRHEEPAVFILLSINPVVWRLDAQAERNVQGVLVSSSYVSTIDGLAKTVPLGIISPKLGNKKHFKPPYDEDDWQKLEQAVSRRFPMAAIHRHGFRNVATVQLR